ncbi:hypothetical protein CDD81_365 [Ophiocordyceps australis]|uniref:F-box protein Hrt3/FBXO9 C-terminal domain-containing protein n=1 Tax=Ophiocordyceps australis TaxID=1399860 RepID=A0A2C5XYC5_9HYPO|nr:hypothetical protein CDD81_365 [Ophiocordyceps australis]
MPTNLDSELDSFRQQWLLDLQAHKATPSSPPQAKPPPWPGSTGPDDGDDALAPEPVAGKQAPPRRLVSALDHFEEAMAMEAQGNMGDSLKLYRTAYRLDHGVDCRYREKHLGPSAPTVEAPTMSPCAPIEAAPLAIPTADLVASFAGLAIQPAPPQVQGDPLPPCPLAALPTELLAVIFTLVAASDPGDVVAAARTCKRLTFLILCQAPSIWKAAALSPRFGFPAMMRRFFCAIDPTADSTPDAELLAAQATAESHVAVSLVPSIYPSWMHMFRSRPRIRFNGCYISTVNYIRSGQASTNLATWGSSPVHIVTYYRYLRFFPDGSALSLLSTTPPVDIVHHLSHQTVRSHRASPATSYLPSAPVRAALYGRWRLGHDQDESNLHVETEGVGPKYSYRMHLVLRSSPSAAAHNGALNTKLAWRAFYSYNKFTDDWVEFGLKNDRSFVFSRVRSYGMAC